MRYNREYQICKDIAIYMRLQYPDVIYRFDMAGLNLSMAQAGMNKAIQCGKGWPDLFIANQSFRGEYKGLFIEIKKEGTKLFNANRNPSTPHISDQIEMINKLSRKGYKAGFCIGFDECKEAIDQYLKP